MTDVRHTRCQIALGHHPDSDPAGWTWTTLGPDDPGGDGRLLVDPAPEVTLGRQDETAANSPADARFSLRNPDGLLSPHDRRSAWWPLWGEGTPVRLQRRVDETWHTRFVGEIVGLSSRLDPVEGVDVVNVTASSVARRQEQGEPPLHSPLRRHITAPNRIGRLLGYWPCEDGPNSQRAASPIPGVQPMTVSPHDAFAKATGHPGSDHLLGFPAGQAGGWNATIPGGPTLSHWRVEWMQRLGTDFADSDLAWFPNQFLRSTGRIARWQIMVDPTPQVAIAAWNGDGGGVILQTAGMWSTVPGRWVMWILDVTQTSTNSVSWYVGLVFMDGPSAGLGNSLLSGTYSGKIGRPRTIENVFPEAPTGGLEIGQFIAATQVSTGWLAPADLGHPRERAALRWARLLREDGVRHHRVGPTGQSPRMGRQAVTTRTELLQECAAVGGLSTETPDDTGRRFRTREDLHNQDPIVIPGSAVAPPLSPSSDDQGRANEVTAARPDGATVTLADEIHQQGDGTRPGHGRYATELPVNVSDDAQLPHHGSWRLTRGTWAEPRAPGLNLTLHTPADEAVWATVRPGDRIMIPDGVAHGHHGHLDLLAEGWRERLGDLWEVQVNASPAGPWQAGILDDGSGTVGEGRLLSSGTTVTATVGTGGTSLPVLTPTGPPWVNSTDHADQFPLDVELGTGEVVTATAITAPTATGDVPVQRVVEDFSEPNADGWGAAVLGGAWQVFGTDASTVRSVSDGAGHVTLTGSTAFGRWQAIGPDMTATETLMSFSADQIATGDDLVAGAVLRLGEVDDVVIGALLDPSGDIALEIWDEAAGAVIDGPIATGVTYAPDEVLWLRARIDDGHRVTGRLWADDTSEPGSWLVDAVASPVPAGQTGVVWHAATLDNTNTDPTLSVHSFEAWELVEGAGQTMTVTRAVNGVVKAVSVGTDVQPAHPFRLPSPGSRINARP